MKNNRKNRKLKFIRKKNNLRLGKRIFKHFVTFTNDVDEELLKIIKNELKKSAEEILFKKYKLTLRNNSFNFGYRNNDFVRNQTTAVIILCNRKL